MLSFLLQTVNVAVLWLNTVVVVPMNEPIEDFKYIPEAKLQMGEQFVEDPDFYMEYEVEYSTFRVIRTNIVGDYRVVYRAHFPTYHFTSDQEIIFRVVENEPPMIEVDDVELPVGSKLPDLKSYVTYYDNYSPQSKVALTIDSSRVNMNQIGSYPVIYKATDESYNETTITKNVIVVDNIAPTIKENKTIEVNIDESIDFSKYYTITDNYDQMVDVVYDDSLVDYSFEGVYPITITATDQSHNSSKRQSKVTVVDNTKLEIKLKYKEITINYQTELNEKELLSYVQNASALNTNDIKITSYVDSTTLGTYEVYYEITNKKRSVTTEILKVHVKDIKKPTLEIIRPLQIELNKLEPYILDYIYVTDNYDNSLDIMVTTQGKVDTSKVGDYRIMVTLKDTSKNEVTYPLVFSVKDLTKPKILQIKEIVVTDFIRPDLQSFFKITDNYDKDLDFEFDESYIDYETVGSYPLIVKATDQSQNEQVYETILKVKDIIAPELVLMNTEVFVSYDEDFDLYDYIESVTDNYDFELNKYHVTIETNIKENKLGRYYVDYTAKDTAGNQSKERLYLTIGDTISPNIEISYIEVKKNEVFDYKKYARATDNYDGDLTNELSFSPNYIPTNTVGTYEGLYYVHDSSGNYAEQRILINVIDNQTKSNYVIYFIAGGAGLTIFAIYYLFNKRKVKF
ncbi:immunoglobulin-like domain-containing protein [Acholeplasma hippikon]|uniref:Bacterial Ig-like domain (Group 3) n=1 Tax=Acholeplasma hippikon TaxID=264636 RepID=A0A449BK64_9MOLU|nr:immunoglobulin-like domain-containing protein [Acholeplasma hippikon]VEU82856.1 Uncharacterised protein [Acholeplasma hippikon]